MVGALFVGNFRKAKMDPNGDRLVQLVKLLWVKTHNHLRGVCDKFKSSPATINTPISPSVGRS